MRTSFYADDAALFVNPIKEELVNISKLLQFFGAVLGLKVNPSKFVLYPIRCKGMDIQDISAAFFLKWRQIFCLID